MLNTLGALSVVHVSGVTNDGEPDSLPWIDVGIYTNAQWATIMRAGLALMSESMFCPSDELAFMVLLRCARWKLEGMVDLFHISRCSAYLNPLAERL
jgi:hypothetical protein